MHTPLSSRSSTTTSPLRALMRSLPSAPSLPLAAAPHCSAPSDRSLSWTPSRPSNVAGDDSGGAEFGMAFLIGSLVFSYVLSPVQSPWISYYHWLAGYTAKKKIGCSSSSFEAFIISNKFQQTDIHMAN